MLAVSDALHLHDFRRLFITDAIMHEMPPHIAQLVASPGTATSTPHGLQGHLLRRSDGHQRSSRAAARYDPARNTAPQSMKNGPSSSATSSTAKSPSATAAAPTTPSASTNTAAYASSDKPTPWDSPSASTDPRTRIRSAGYLLQGRESLLPTHRSNYTQDQERPADTTPEQSHPAPATPSSRAASNKLYSAACPV